MDPGDLCNNSGCLVKVEHLRTWHLEILATTSTSHELFVICVEPCGFIARALMETVTLIKEILRCLTCGRYSTQISGWFEVGTGTLLFKHVVTVQLTTAAFILARLDSVTILGIQLVFPSFSLFPPGHIGEWMPWGGDTSPLCKVCFYYS